MAGVPVRPEALTAALALILRGGGCLPDIAAEVAAALVEADQSGHGTHGARQIDFYVGRLRRGEVDGTARPVMAQDDGAVLRIDGRRAFGQIAGEMAARLGTARARETGACVVCLAGSGHLGRNGRWAEIATAEGVGSLHFGQGIPGPGPVAPFGGREGRLNTNPVAFGLPGTGPDDALIFDAATSAVSSSTLKQMVDRGEQLAEPVLVRQDGAPSADPADFVRGMAAVLPFGGFKGYALAVFSEVLSSIVAPGGRGGAATNSLFSVYFDLARLLPPDTYRSALAEWRERILSCPPAGAAPVLLPGDRARAARSRGLTLGADVAARIRIAAEMLELWPQAVALCPPLAVADAGASVKPSIQTGTG